MLRFKINMFMLAILWIFVRKKEPECGSNTWHRFYFVLVCIAAYACSEIKCLKIQINQPTRCNSFTSLLFDVYVWLNMFWVLLCPSSGAYNCTRSLWFHRWNVAVGALLVVVWPVGRPRPTTLLPPRSNGKTRGC
jgi:hypothetical protein